LSPLRISAFALSAWPLLLGRATDAKAELGADALAILLKEPTCKLGPVVRNDMAWDPESADNRLEEATAAPWVMLTTGVASGHFVNLSMATKRKRYPPTTLGMVYNAQNLYQEDINNNNDK
jgi:hypothetical protein